MDIKKWLSQLDTPKKGIYLKGKHSQVLYSEPLLVELKKIQDSSQQDQIQQDDRVDARQEDQERGFVPIFQISQSYEQDPITLNRPFLKPVSSHPFSHQTVDSWYDAPDSLLDTHPVTQRGRHLDHPLNTHPVTQMDRQQSTATAKKRHYRPHKLY